jgi:hypothetical protein
VGEEAVGLIELAGVCVGVVVAGVELEGADGKEGLVGRVAFGVGVEDGDEFGEFGAVFWRDAEGSEEGAGPTSQRYDVCVKENKCKGTGGKRGGELTSWRSAHRWWVSRLVARLPWARRRG